MTQEQFVVDLQRRRNELVEEAESIRQLLVQDQALDRTDKDKESLRVLVVTALNGLYRRDKEIADLQAQITALKEQNIKLSMPEGGAVDEFIQYHHNPIVGQKNTEIATLQSQITALKRERDSWLGSKDGKIKGEHWEVVEDAAQTITDLQAKLSTWQERWARENGENLQLQAKLSVCKEALDDSLSGFKYVRLRNSVDCDYGNGLGYERCIFKIEQAIAKAALEGGK